MFERRFEGLEDDIRRLVREETQRVRPEVPPPPPAQALPSADPTPVGLAGFALTTFLFSIINAGWLEQIGTFIPLAFFYGGLAQLLAGMWAFRQNNLFGAVVFTSYGAFWGAVGFFFYSAANLGVLADIGASVGFTLVAWTVFTLYVCVAALKVNRAVFVTFIVFALTLLFWDLGFGLAVPALVVVGGYTGILLALCAWYTSAAGLINHTFGRVVVPLGPPVGQPPPGLGLMSPPEYRVQPPPEQEPSRQGASTPLPPPAPTPDPATPTPPPQPTAEETPHEFTSQANPKGPAPTAEPSGEPISARPFQTRAAAQEPVEHTRQRETDATEAPVAQGLEDVERGRRREDMRSVIRDSVGRSGVPGQEAPQTVPPPAAPEEGAGATGLPIEGYDSLNVAQLTRRLSGLSVEELERLQDYEAKNQNRRLLIERFGKRIRMIRRADSSTL